MAIRKMVVRLWGFNMSNNVKHVREVEYVKEELNGKLKLKIIELKFHPNEIDIKYYLDNGNINDGRQAQKGWLFEASIPGIPKEDVVKIVLPTLEYDSNENIFTTVSCLVRK